MSIIKDILKELLEVVGGVVVGAFTFIFVAVLIKEAAKNEIVIFAFSFMGVVVAEIFYGCLIAIMNRLGKLTKN